LSNFLLFYKTTVRDVTNFQDLNLTNVVIITMNVYKYSFVKLKLLEKYKIAGLAALAGIVLTTVVITLDIGPHIALAYTNTTTSFRHFTNTTANTTVTATNPTTPIKHIVVIFQENNSFDHYFGTYPHAANPVGESPFMPDPKTPHVNNLEWPNDLLKNNPNQYWPHRIDPHQGKICSPLHEYKVEQKSYNGGKMDKFVENDGNTSLDPGLKACEVDNNRGN
jgi:phospholipase C